MRSSIAAIVVIGLLCTVASGAWAGPALLAQAPAGGAAEKLPAKGGVGAVQVRGTIAAIDKDKGTVTLKGPGGRTVTLEVRDKQKFDVIKVGDPVVARYVEALAIQVKRSGTATPGVSVQETRVSSKPGETPAGAVGREISITATITAIDKKAGAVTIKGPEGGVETVKTTNPKNLDVVKVGDLVDITYTQALAVSLDKPGK